MRKLSSLFLVFLVLLCLNACKDESAPDDVFNHLKSSSAPAINVDGDFSEWGAIPSYVSSGDANSVSLREIKLAADNQYIYVYVKMDKDMLSGILSTYMDYDLNKATGYNIWFADFGAEGVSQATISKKDAGFKEYIGDSGDWNWTSIVKNGLYEKWSDAKETGDYAEFEFSMKREYMQGMNNERVGLVFVLENTQWETKGRITGADKKPIVLNLKTGMVESEEADNFVEEYAIDNTIFPNPERGWYKHESWHSETDSSLSLRRLKEWREKDAITQVFTLYYLGDYIDKPLSNGMLNLIQTNFNLLRESGMKAVVRFAYTKNKEGVIDAPVERTIEHINQLAPLLQKNVDVIAVLEAGFIGAYGEWYYTSNYGNSKEPGYPVRRKLIDALLTALPKERMICLRTPEYKTKILEIDFSNPLSASEAYSRTSKARLAHHNDCFLANDTDMGTFKTPESRTYTAIDSRYVCVGGETCAPSSYAECTNAIESMEKYHWSYLNKDYHKTVISDWQLNGCLDDILRRLGYRFVLKTVEHPQVAISGKPFRLKIILENVGFAAPYNPRSCDIIVRSQSGAIVYRQSLNTDPRYWFAGEEVEITETISLPQDIVEGKYDILLSLHDPQQSIASRPEYAVRLANQGVWEEATGYNKLFQQNIK